jgi:hypothetical protein
MSKCMHFKREVGVVMRYLLCSEFPYFIPFLIFICFISLILFLTCAYWKVIQNQFIYTEVPTIPIKNQGSYIQSEGLKKLHYFKQ